MSKMLAALSLAAVAAGCGSPSTTTTAPAPAPSPEPALISPAAGFARAAERFYWEHFEYRPPLAVYLGHHKYDGRLPDRSPAAIQAELDRLRQAKTTFEAVSPAALDDGQKLEREVLLTEIRRQIFDLEIQRPAFRNPISYMGSLALTAYISRPYAPLDQRARAIIAIAEGAPAYLEQAKANLEPALPRTWIDNALLQARGMIEFARTDVATAMAGVTDPVLADKLRQALDVYADAITDYIAFLDGRLTAATDDFALGEANFLRMLADSEGLDIDMARLQAIGVEDLARNKQAMTDAAHQIDRRAPITRTIEKVNRKQPRRTGLIAAATTQSDQMRQLLVDKQIVTIPSDDRAEVRESPAFLRWNSAFLDSAGAFEATPLPSFYYISPPDPKWPKKEQQAYIPSFGNLLFTTVHELWPGHFLHSLHRKRVPSKIVKSYCTYSMSEGWAHYTEEMMWEQGAGDGDPAMHIGQLGDALLRNVRYMSAIGLHTRGMTVDQSIALFKSDAFTDAQTARQQALRGTFDAGYLNYTLGKLMIRKLREDWRAKVGDRFSLKEFHDRFLSYGCAPVPVIRRMMLGEDAGSAL